MNSKIRNRKIKVLFKLSSKSESLINEDLFYQGLDNIDYYEDTGEDYYPDIPKSEIEDEKSKGNIFYGRDINWIGTRGQMIRVPTNNIYPMEDNIFDMKKMRGLQKKIEYSDEKVFLYAPYVMVSVVSPETIKDVISENYMINLTTGDEDLDSYLRDEEEWLENNLNLYNFPEGLIDSYDSESILSLEERKDDLMESGDLDEFDKEELSKIIEAQPYINKIKEMQSKYSSLIENPRGDVGELIYQVRDGNHRAFAAKYIGEEYVWCFVEENQLNDIKRNPDRYKSYNLEIY